MKHLVNSFTYAFRGVVYALKTERNFRIHVVAAVIVVILMAFFHLRQWEYAFLTYTIGSVLILELINTVFERVTDVLQPRMHPYAQVMKDLMAAAVLIASIGALIIGIVILGPHVLTAIQSYLY